MDTRQRAIQKLRDYHPHWNDADDISVLIHFAEQTVRAEDALAEAVWLLESVREELDNRYDGADDSRSKWMGSPLQETDAFLAHRGKIGWK